MVIAIHQLALPYCRKSLQCLGIRWPMTQTQRCNTTGDCARGNDQHFVMLLA